jgi:isochorismate synthase
MTHDGALLAGSADEKLMQVLVEIPDLDPLSLLDLRPDGVFSCPDGRAWLAWHERDLSVIGWGQANSVDCDGTTSIAALRQACSQTIEQVELATALPLPLLFGGLCFDRQPAKRERNAGSCWRLWPMARFCLPEMVVIRYHELTAILLHRPKSEPVDAALQRVRSLRAQVLAYVAAKPTRTKARQPSTRVGRSEEQPASFRARVAAAQRNCAANHAALDKVVLAREVSFSAADGAVFDPTATLLSLEKRFPRCTLFSMRNLADDSTFLGATPESLVRLDGRRVRTAALAGTRPRAQAASLLQSEKDRHEQGLVTEMLRQALRPLLGDSLQVGETELRELENVAHLQTEIHGSLRKPGHILELVEKLHPTPAVGGWPTVDALEHLTRTEHLDRGWYAAPVGWIDPLGGGHMAVALRSALVTAARAHAFVGAGITADSDPRAEWDETERKLEAIAGSLHLEPQKDEFP